MSTTPTIDQLTPGTAVLDADEDPTSPPRLGTVVEPTPAEAEQARREVCGFDADDLAPGDGVVLVRWAWPEQPDVEVTRDWRWVDELQLAPTSSKPAPARATFSI